MNSVLNLSRSSQSFRLVCDHTEKVDSVFCTCSSDELIPSYDMYAMRSMIRILHINFTRLSIGFWQFFDSGMREEKKLVHIDLRKAKTAKKLRFTSTLFPIQKRGVEVCKKMLIQIIHMQGLSACTLEFKCEWLP